MVEDHLRGGPQRIEKSALFQGLLKIVYPSGTPVGLPETPSGTPDTLPEG